MQLDGKRMKSVSLESSDGTGGPSSVSRAIRLFQDRASLNEVSRLAWSRMKVAMKQLQEPPLTL